MSENLLHSKLDYSVLETQVKRYLPTTKKSLSEVLNQRAANVIGRAFNATPRADPVRIKTSLGQIVKVNRINKKGKIKQVKTFVGTKSKIPDAPLLALIINKRRGQKGLPGLYGPAMTKALIKTLGFRLRSIGFEASGWIPGLRIILAKVKGAFIIARLSTARVYKTNKGGATPANDSSWYPKAEVFNTVKEIDKVGSRALQRAIDDEAKDLAKHIDEKLQPETDKFNQDSKK